MAETTMKNQPSQLHCWWLDDNTTVRRSPWLQSTLTELNEKTKAMLKLIEGDADSFAQRAEMFYKKRPELASMVEDFYRTYRLLAERYDQVRPEAGLRLLTPSASLKHSQSDKLMSFDDDHGYDSYFENCDVDESVESEIVDPEHEEEEHEEVRSVAANEVMKLRKEIELLGEKKKAHKDQIKPKDDIRDEVMTLREEIERLKKENVAQKEEFKQKDNICNEIMKKLRKEIEQLKKENETQKDQLKPNDTSAICDEVMKLREEIERLEKENEAKRDELKEKSTICNEVMNLRKELERQKKESEAQKNELKHQDSICDEVMMLKEEKERVKEENMTQKDDLKQKDKEKIEVIRQLSSTIDLLKQENVEMRSFIAKECSKKWKTPFEINKLVGKFSEKLLKKIPKNKPSIVAL